MINHDKSRTSNDYAAMHGENSSAVDSLKLSEPVMLEIVFLKKIHRSGNIPGIFHELGRFVYYHIPGHILLVYSLT
jgi:hypothetical protein